MYTDYLMTNNDVYQCNFLLFGLIFSMSRTAQSKKILIHNKLFHLPIYLKMWPVIFPVLLLWTWINPRGSKGVIYHTLVDNCPLNLWYAIGVPLPQIVNKYLITAGHNYNQIWRIEFIAHSSTVDLVSKARAKWANFNTFWATLLEHFNTIGTNMY